MKKIVFLACLFICAYPFQLLAAGDYSKFIEVWTERAIKHGYDGATDFAGVGGTPGRGENSKLIYAPFYNWKWVKGVGAHQIFIRNGTLIAIKHFDRDGLKLEFGGRYHYLPFGKSFKYLHYSPFGTKNGGVLRLPVFKYVNVRE